MRRFFLYANPGKPEALQGIRAFAGHLLSRGCEVLMEPWLHGLIGMGEVRELPQLNREIQAVVSFGGDGTLLRVLPTLAQHDIPVLGINMGHTGFLLEIAPDDLPAAAERLANRDYEIEKRSMLECVINHDKRYLLMNELALTRGQNPNSLLIGVYYDEELVFTIHGDGVLVSTSTGTTAYSLSAGGPILYPGLACHVVVPICSHVLTQRPVVLPAEGEIRLEVHSRHEEAYQINLDGQVVLNARAQTAIRLTAASREARFIRFEKQRFFTRLQQKQLEWNAFVNGGKV